MNDGQEISKLQKMIGEAAEREHVSQLSKQRDETIELLVKVQSATFEKAVAYINVIILAGYAGTFTLLAATKEVMPIKSLIIVALLLAFSLIIFCGWEITKMIYFGRHNLKIGPLINQTISPDDFFKKLSDFKLEESRSIIRINKWWPAVLCLSVILGFSAGAILLAHYISYLVQ